MDRKRAPMDWAFFRVRSGWIIAITSVALSLLLSCRVGQTAPAKTVAPSPVPTAAPSTRTASPATAPSDATKDFESHDGHFRISYSAAWHAQAGTTSSTGDYQGKKVQDTTVLTLLPSGAKNSDRSIGVDLPELPPHIPGLIPLGMVTSGYISDLRKQHPDLKVEESQSTTIPDARAHRVRLTWKEKDRGCFDMAVLIVHKDQILIFSADGDGDGYDEIRKVFDPIISSIKWVK